MAYIGTVKQLIASAARHVEHNGRGRTVQAEVHVLHSQSWQKHDGAQHCKERESCSGGDDHCDTVQPSLGASGAETTLATTGVSSDQTPHPINF